MRIVLMGKKVMQAIFLPDSWSESSGYRISLRCGWCRLLQSYLRQLGVKANVIV